MLGAASPPGTTSGKKNMSIAITQAGTRLADLNDFVSSDFLALASHMNACQRSRGRFFQLQSTLEALHGAMSPRIVTTAAVFAVCGLSLLAFA